MRAKLIAYECVAPTHGASLAFPDKLTIHDGEWAFCAFDAHAAGHQWHATGDGVDLDALRRRAGLSTLAATKAGEETSTKA